jgi:hypothetical protein
VVGGAYYRKREGRRHGVRRQARRRWRAGRLGNCGQLIRRGHWHRKGR